MIGTIVTIEINKLDHQGRGIGSIYDKAIFVQGALPGEVIKVVIETEKKKYLEGRLLEVITRSKDRVEVPKPYDNKVGGADIIHMSETLQMVFKEQKIMEIMKRYVGIDIKQKPLLTSLENRYYRNKTTFHVSPSGRIGYYQKGSHDVIEIEECILSDIKINSILRNIKDGISLVGITSIIVRASKYTDDIMVIWEANEIANEEKMVELLSSHVTTIIKRHNRQDTVLYGPGYIVEKVKQFEFQISPESFFQVNTEQMIRLYDVVATYAGLTGEESVLDLYCGTGTIGIYLSKYAKEVIGIEVNHAAILDAEENAKRNHIDNIRFIVGNTSQIHKQQLPVMDVVVVDPPRSGLDENTIGYLIKHHFKKVVYVSCDPMTLARDLKQLSVSYDIVELTPVDMFLQTHHVECVVLLTNRDNSVVD